MLERQVKKLKGSHYVATQNNGRITSDLPYVHSNRGYSTDGEESHQAISERTHSEYAATPQHILPKRNYDLSDNASQLSQKAKSESKHHYNRGSSLHNSHYNQRHDGGYPSSPIAIDGTRKYSPGGPRPPPSALSYDHGIDADSDIYVTSGAYKTTSEISPYSERHQSRKAPRSLYSVASTAKTGRSGRSTTNRGAKVDVMSAPNPFCPNVRGVCCLMLLLNLGLILVTLGFVIVVQFYEPLYIWVLGIIFLIFGFLTLIGCMVYCVHVCRDAKMPSQVRAEDLYWTHHWQKNIGYTPQEINYKSEKYDAYSDRYSICKMSGKHSDHESYRY